MTTATAVRKKPILFSGPMVRAILEGRKSVTRRPVTKINPAYLAAHCDVGRDDWKKNRAVLAAGTLYAPLRCPYGVPGDRLWVRESWCPSPDGPIYRATESESGVGAPDDFNVWKPSIHMPRAHSRITLAITEVRIERLQEVSDGDAAAEGAHTERPIRIAHPLNPSRSLGMGMTQCTHRESFALLWDSLNAKRGYGWDVNPWVWVISFSVASPEHGTPASNLGTPE